MARSKDGPNHAVIAALIGGAAAATAGAFWSARSIARRNGVRNGKLSPVMEAAATAYEVAHGENAAGMRAEPEGPTDQRSTSATNLSD